MASWHIALGVVAALVSARLVTAALPTWRARAWVPLLSRRLAPWVRARSYSDEEFFAADGASEARIGRRRRGLERLAARMRSQHARSGAWGKEIRESFSDLRFTDA